MPHVAVVSRLLDAASAGAAPALDGNLLCQICLDAPAAVSQLCGAACLAELCASCVARHLAAGVYAFYPGVLPKVRCPVCLTLLNKSQWQKFVQKEPQQQEQEQVDDNSHVLDKYAVLCRQSCGFQSPCCHNADYTMLPHCDSTGDGEDKLVELTSLQVEALPELLVRAVEFCYHRQDTSELYEFMTDKFQDKVEEVLSKLLPKIDDEERRAALLLWHLSKNPNTQTRCCKAAVCFKCKATNHHDGNCRDFVEEENVVECRGCGVTVVMVEGCDSLRCL
ncbi:unnamed protein product [Phytophthora lilii]|uniref:Unnamed protein product n=1 Tax=Phytophthora lilii TaxID=2077276 RepID=A0A9W7CPL1_9STRA|nr:unnamed protein product [Phytophthora lilii]